MAAWAGNRSVIDGDVATEARLHEIRSMLVKKGANLRAETTAEHQGVPAGSTPLSVASQKGHSEVVKALVGAGATLRDV